MKGKHVLFGMITAVLLSCILIAGISAAMSPLVNDYPDRDTDGVGDDRKGGEGIGPGEGNTPDGPEGDTHGDAGERSEDSDMDLINDEDEHKYGTDPENPDTDGDGLMDGWELILGLDPNDWDTDNDMMRDGNEPGPRVDSTDGHLIDTDNDGL